MCICPLSQSKSTPRDKDECPVFVKSDCVYREVPRLNNEIRYAHHHTPQKDKNANLCNYWFTRPNLFNSQIFCSFSPENEQCQEYFLSACLCGDARSFGWFESQIWSKENFISLQAKDTSDCETTRLWKHLHLYSETINELKM